MSLEGMTENDLVARLKAGDEVAFAGLYSRHMPAMIRVAAGVVAGRAAAEEVAQDAWLAILKNISGSVRTPPARYSFIATSPPMTRVLRRIMR
jgi:RNA polymerase sigma-70 factor (ECF subfamily)